MSKKTTQESKCCPSFSSSVLSKSPVHVFLACLEPPLKGEERKSSSLIDLLAEHGYRPWNFSC